MKGVSGEVQYTSTSLRLIQTSRFSVTKLSFHADAEASERIGIAMLI